MICCRKPYTMFTNLFTAKLLGVLTCKFIIVHNYSALGTQAAEGAHQSYCRVQKQAAAAPARLRSSYPRSFCPGRPTSHVSQDARPDDDGPTGDTSNEPAPWHGAPRWDACQDAPRAALYWWKPTPAPCSSWSQWCQGPGSSWGSNRILPTGTWNAGCRSQASPRKAAST